MYDYTFMNSDNGNIIFIFISIYNLKYIYTFSLMNTLNLDIGCYIEVHSIANDLKHKLILSPFKPDKYYNFKKDLDPGANRGPFV